MKKNLQKLLSLLCALSLFFSSVGAAYINDFSDVSGHWAEEALTRAVSDGLLHGANGKLMPDDSLTGAQMAAILNRVLAAENTDRTYPNTPAGQWYTLDAHKAASLGVLPTDGSLKLNQPVTRGEVFQALAAAFGLEEAEPSETILSSFHDHADLTPTQRRAAAVLVRDQLVSGAKGGTLDAARSITRAEFMALIYRISAPAYLTLVQPEKNTPAEPAPVADPSAEPAQPPIEASQNQIENQPAPTLSPVYLYQTHPNDSAFAQNAAYDRVVLRGNASAFSPSSVAPASIRRLVIATTGADFSLSKQENTSLETVVIGGGTGAVTLTGTLTRAVEITGSGRTVDLRGVSLDSLVISGSDNTVLTDEVSSVYALRVLPGAARNHVTIGGGVSSASLAGSYTTLDGQGAADEVIITAKCCTLTLAARVIDNRADNGLEGVSLKLQAPTVAPGGQITASATITGVDTPRVVSAQWYFDGAADATFANPALTLGEGLVSNYRRALTFEKNMVLSHTAGLRITYQNRATGELETLFAETPITIQNYPASHYLPDASEVLAKVHPTYKRGNSDYSKAEKAIFVNAKGYKSPTKYLVWISRSAQKVNVFEGSQNNWKLIHEFACATGAAGMDTPVGVTYVTYKQTGWTTPNYTCRPIVRFYPGTGYAFHSRLYYPGTNRVLDGSMGFPVSHGCVRMMDEGINWLYNNVPSKTTVVIY